MALRKGQVETQVQQTGVDLGLAGWRMEIGYFRFADAGASRLRLGG